MEAFVFVVNADNPIEELTSGQLRDIYSGKITNWKEVGGNDAPIIAYQRNETSGRQNYMKLFMGDTPNGINIPFSHYADPENLHSDYYNAFPLSAEIKVLNGYLSVAVSLCFEDASGDCKPFVYDCRTAVYNLVDLNEITDIRDMFTDGTDISVLLDSAVRTAILTRYNGYDKPYVMTGDFVAITVADAEYFTLDGIILPSVSSLFVTGTEIPWAKKARHLHDGGEL